MVPKFVDPYYSIILFYDLFGNLQKISGGLKTIMNEPSKTQILYILAI